MKNGLGHRRLRGLVLLLVLAASAGRAQTPPGTVIANTARGTYADRSGVLRTGVSSMVQTPVAAGAYLQVQALADYDPVLPGDRLRWTLVVRNPGNVGAENVELRAAISGPALLLDPGGATEVGKGELLWPTFGLEAGAETQMVVQVQASQDAQVEALLGIDWQARSGNAGSAAAASQSRVASSPNLALSLESDLAEVVPGQEYHYWLGYRNRGSVVALQPRLADQLPPEVEFVSADPPPAQVRGQVLVWALDRVERGQAGQIDLKVRLRETVAPETEVTNTLALAGLANPPPVVESEPRVNLVQVVAPAAPLGFTKEVEGENRPLGPGDPLVFRLVVDNTQAGARSQVVLRDTLDPLLIIETVETGAALRQEGQAVEVFWARLAAGVRDTVRIQTRVRPGLVLRDSLVNQAWANAPGAGQAAAAVAVPLKNMTNDGLLSAPEKIMPGQPLALVVSDPDQNRDAAGFDSVLVEALVLRTGEQERVWLRETAVEGVFAGGPATFTGEVAGPVGDGVMWVRPGDQIQATYRDPLSAGGQGGEQTTLTRVLGTRIEVRAEPSNLVANGRDQALLAARVFDSEGTPLPDGLEVAFVADQGSFAGGVPRAQVPVQGGGGAAQIRYTAPALAGNAVARVVAIFGGFESAPIQLQVVPGAGAIRVFDQVRGEEVRADDPTLEVVVRLVGQTVEGTPIEMTIQLDQGGLYVIPEIPPGRYQLLARVTEVSSGRVISDGKLQDIVVEADGSTTPPANAVSGTLRGKGDRSGTRYAGATVELVDESGRVLATAVVGEDGSYDFQNLPPGLYILRATLPDGSTASAEVSPRTVASGSVIVNADILIDPFGVVFDAATGAPIPGATVALRFLDGEVLPIPRLNGTGAAPNRDNINPFVSTAEGRYAFLFGGSQVGRVGEPAEYYLTATPPAEATFLERRFRISVEPATDEPLETAVITMQVSSADGLPMARPNDVALTLEPIFVADIETIAFNIPVFNRAPALQLQLSPQPDSAAAGDEVLFELRATNAGNLASGAVAVVDTLSGAWQLGRVENGTATDNVARWNLPGIEPGQSVTLAFWATLRDPAGNQHLTERAWLEAEGLLPVQATASLGVKRPAWALEKRATPTEAGAGDLVRYVLSYRNLGTAAGPAFTLVDSLPAGLEVVEAPGARNEGARLVWDRPALAPGSSDSVSLVARLAATPVAAGLVTNTAVLLQADAAGQAKEVARAVCTLGARPLVVTLAKQVNREILSAGEVAEYTLNLSSGGGDLAGWVLSDALPPQLVYAGQSSEAATYDEASNTLSWPVPPLDEAGQWTVRFAARARPGLEPGEHPTRNVARAGLGALEAVSEPASMTVVVNYLRVGLRVDQPVVEPGEVAVYRATVENLSAADSLHLVDLAVLPPAGFRFLPGSARLDGQPLAEQIAAAKPASTDTLLMPGEPRVLRWALPGLAPGQRRELVFHVVVGAGAAEGDGLAQAQARGRSVSGVGVQTSTPTQIRLRVQPSELFELGQLIIGRAWVDADGNGEVDPGEAPVPGVVLAMDDGTRIIADRHGRFSVPQVERADRVVRLLASNLPPGLEPVLAPHALGDPWSRLIAPGRAGLAKANFPFRQVPADTVVPPPVVVEPEPPPPPPVLVPAALTRSLTQRLSWPGRALGFATGSVELGAAERALLDSVAQYLKAAPPLRLGVEGHADVQRVARLAYANNQDLALARAWAVARYLALAGVDSSRMDVLSRGDQQPIADNSTAEGRRRNRRVELVPQGPAPALRLLILQPLMPPGTQAIQAVGTASLVAQGAVAESLWVAAQTLRELPHPVLMAPGPVPWSRQDSSAVEVDQWQTQLEAQPAAPAGEEQR